MPKAKKAVTSNDTRSMYDRWFSVLPKQIGRIPSVVRSHNEFVQTAMASQALCRPSASAQRARTLHPINVLPTRLERRKRRERHGSRRLMTIRIKPELSRKHPENLRPENYAMSCVGRLGVKWSKLPDRRPQSRNPTALTSGNRVSHPSLAGCSLPAKD